MPKPRKNGKSGRKFHPNFPNLENKVETTELEQFEKEQQETIENSIELGKSFFANKAANRHSGNGNNIDRGDSTEEKHVKIGNRNNNDICERNDPEKPPTKPGNKDGGKYDPNTIFYLQMMYIIAILIWVIIIVILKLYETDIVGWIILLIPFLVFTICFASLWGVDIEVENFMLQGNFLYFGYIIIALIIGWTGGIKDTKLFHLIGLGLILLMISIIDVWVDKKKLVYVKHFESISQTLAAVIFIFTLYYYYFQYIYKQGGGEMETKDIGKKFNKNDDIPE